MKNRTLKLKGNLGVFQRNLPPNRKTSFTTSLTSNFIHSLPGSHTFMRMPIPYFNGPFC